MTLQQRLVLWGLVTDACVEEQLATHGLPCASIRLQELGLVNVRR